MVADWIGENSYWIMPLTSIGTLLVWVFYAQLLYNGYTRQRRPRLLINQGVGEEGLDSPCLICNMSSEAIYVYFMMVSLETSEKSVFVPITDCEHPAGREIPETLNARTRQGPLASGRCLEVSSFRGVLEHAAGHADIELKDGLPVDPEVQLRALEFHVICMYGSDDSPFGAVRRFNLNLESGSNGALSLVPTSIDTQRKTSWRYKRKIRRWLEEYG